LNTKNFYYTNISCFNTKTKRKVNFEIIKFFYELSYEIGNVDMLPDRCLDMCLRVGLVFSNEHCPNVRVSRLQEADELLRILRLHFCVREQLKSTGGDKRI
jgi:hypothetical protein